MQRKPQSFGTMYLVVQKKLTPSLSGDTPLNYIDKMPFTLEKIFILFEQL